MLDTSSFCVCDLCKKEKKHEDCFNWTMFSPSETYPVTKDISPFVTGYFFKNKDAKYLCKSCAAKK